MTFEDIQKVNEGLKTTDIKGKDYVEVAQRIKAFRQLVPDGFIETEMLSNENGMCVFKATIGITERLASSLDGDLIPMNRIILATGHAYEKEQSSYINKTSYIENCETSAVGRALGMLGLGIDTSVASAEEVQNAIEQQEKMSDDGMKATKSKAQKIEADDPVITHDKVEVAKAIIKQKQVTLASVMKAYGVDDLKNLRESQYANLLIRLENTPNK